MSIDSIMASDRDKPHEMTREEAFAFCEKHGIPVNRAADPYDPYGPGMGYGLFGHQPMPNRGARIFFLDLVAERAKRGGKP